VIWLHVAWMAVASALFLVVGAWVGWYFPRSPLQFVTGWSIFGIGLAFLVIFIVLTIVGVKGEPR